MADEEDVVGQDRVFGQEAGRCGIGHGSFVVGCEEHGGKMKLDGLQEFN